MGKTQKLFNSARIKLFLSILVLASAKRATIRSFQENLLAPLCLQPETCQTFKSNS